MPKLKLISVLLGCLFATAGTPVAFAYVPGSDSSDALAAIDRNRSSIIADIVEGAQGELARLAPGRVAEESARLAERLSKLRADRLLAASLASTYASLQAILRDAEALAAGAPNRSVLKALGDPNRDLVYTPLAPCRLIDTRGFGAPIQGGPFAPGERRAYVPGGACGVPTSGIASMLVSVSTQNLTPGSGGYISLLPPGGPVLTSVDLFAGVWSETTTAVATGPGGQFDVYVNGATAQVVVDVLGYFAPAIGAAGLQGPTGATGAAGPQGPTGATGAAGATGTAGAAGTQGPVGATGPQGSIGVTGAPGATGAAGSNGRTVLTGATAPTGADGSDGDFYIDNVAHLLYGPKAAGAWPTPGVSLVGPTGLTGSAGTTGATGGTGPQGIAGATGATGGTGPQGTAGATGATGGTGPQGIAGATGATGGTGPQGIAGATGATGGTGPQGIAGATGATGGTGPQGIAGATGATGGTGGTGPQGVAGATGATGGTGGTGPQGIQGIQGIAGATGATGGTGPSGTNGSTGAPGATGATGAMGLGTFIARFNNPANNILNYVSFGSSGSGSTVYSTSAFPMAGSCTFDAIYLTGTAINATFLAANTLTYTLYKNGSPTALSVSLAAPTVLNTTTSTNVTGINVAVVAGDTVAIGLDQTNGAGSLISTLLAARCR